MAARIFDFPGEDVRPAGQPLIFSIDDTISSPPGRFVVVVKITSQVTGGTPVQLAKFYLTPNTEGVAFFDLSPIAESVLKYPTKNTSGVVHEVDDVEEMDQQSIYRFIVEVGSYNTTTGNEALNQDDEDIFVTNGTEQIADGLHPSFSAYYWGNSIGWLTERLFLPDSGIDKTQMTMRSDEERTISLLAADSMGKDIAAPGVKITFVPKSGAPVSITQTTTFTSNARTRMKHVPIGWPNIEDLQSTYTLEQLDYVQFFVVDGTTRVGNIVKVSFDDTRGCRNTATQVAWINTKGGWEYLRFDTRAPKQISVEGKTYRKTIGTYGSSTFSFDAAGSQYDTFAKTGKEQFTLQENFFDVNERALLDSLMKSRLVQIRRMDEDVWKPVTVKTNSLTIQPAGSQFYNVSLQVEIAQDIRC